MRSDHARTLASARRRRRADRLTRRAAALARRAADLVEDIPSLSGRRARRFPAGVLDATALQGLAHPLRVQLCRPAQPARPGDGDAARRSPRRVERGDQLSPPPTREVRLRRGGSEPRHRDVSGGGAGFRGASRSRATRSPRARPPATPPSSCSTSSTARKLARIQAWRDNYDRWPRAVGRRRVSRAPAICVSPLPSSPRVGDEIDDA